MVQAPAAPQAATPAGTAAPTAEAAAIKPIAQVLPTSPRVAIDTPKLKGSINLKGARIDDIELPTYKADDREELAARAPLLARRHQGRLFRGLRLERQRPQDCPTPIRSGRPTARALTPRTPVTLSWDNGAGQRFKITL